MAWLVAGAFAALTTLLVLVALAERRQRRRIDSLFRRLEKIEARWEGETAAKPPARRATPVEAPPGDDPPAGDPPRDDVLAGLTSHVRHVVEGGETEADSLADQAIARVHRRLNANLTPGELAEALCVSLRTLERGLAEALDCTPSQLILAMKMREARRMLLSGRYRVGEVADRLGFSSPFHFSRRFKAYYRVPPSELRDPGRAHR